MEFVKRAFVIFPRKHKELAEKILEYVSVQDEFALSEVPSERPSDQEMPAWEDWFLAVKQDMLAPYTFVVMSSSDIPTEVLHQTVWEELNRIGLLDNLRTNWKPLTKTSENEPKTADTKQPKKSNTIPSIVIDHTRHTLH